MIGEVGHTPTIHMCANLWQPEKFNILDGPMNAPTARDVDLEPPVATTTRPGQEMTGAP